MISPKPASKLLIPPKFKLLIKEKTHTNRSQTMITTLMQNLTISIRTNSGDSQTRKSPNKNCKNFLNQATGFPSTLQKLSPKIPVHILEDNWDNFSNWHLPGCSTDKIAASTIKSIDHTNIINGSLSDTLANLSCIKISIQARFSTLFPFGKRKSWEECFVMKWGWEKQWCL